MLSYPAPYYAIVASAMAVGWNVSHHSIVEAFFFGRLVNVLYLIGTLIFAYAILTETQLTSLQRRLVFIAVAFLPMSDWMSGYIQPDNQTTLLTSAAIYFALRARREPVVMKLAFPLAVAECSLGFTKFHYAATVLVAIAIALRSKYAEAPLKKRVAFGLLTIGLPLISIAIARSTLPAGTFRGASVGEGYARLTAVARLAHAAKLIGDEAVASYLGGSVFDGFWFHFGIRAGRAFGDSASLRTAFGFALICATAIAIVSVSLRQILVLRRLLRLARRRTRAAALRFVGNDIHLNVYIFLTLLLFSLSAAADGYLALQARYWQPILTSTFVIGVSSLGLSNRGRRRRYAITVGCAVIAVSAVALAPASLAAMHAEFYAAKSPTTTRELGEIGGVRIGSRYVSPDEVVVPQGTAFEVSGVALDGETGREARDVRVSVDGLTSIRATTGESASRLAILFNDATLGHAGYSASIRTDRFAPGRHVLSVTAVERRAPTGLPIASMSFTVASRVRR
ncbi:MAG: hypothetical protein NVS2B3_08960 [Vulcanimicrobiaceae bacterium]